VGLSKSIGTLIISNPKDFIFSKDHSQVHQRSTKRAWCVHPYVGIDIQTGWERRHSRLSLHIFRLRRAPKPIQSLNSSAMRPES
jgi:hypothetical protein